MNVMDVPCTCFFTCLLVDIHVDRLLYDSSGHESQMDLDFFTETAEINCPSY